MICEEVEEEEEFGEFKFGEIHVSNKSIMYPRGVRDLTIGLAWILRVTVTDESVGLVIVELVFDPDRLALSVSFGFGGSSDDGAAGRRDSRDGARDACFRLPAAASAVSVVVASVYRL